MRRAFGVTTLFVAAAIGLSACERVASLFAAGVPPPRSFMQGGVWFPEATGYWFHQYVESEELTNFMSDVGFACAPADGKPGAGRLRCERTFRFLGGILSRSDSAEFSFRRNGAVESAESGCRYTFFDSPKLSGTCRPFAAPGAVYPDVASFAELVYAMLRPAAQHQPINVYRLQPAPPAPLPDAHAAVDRLTGWRFKCDFPRQHYRVGFRGKIGEITEVRCQQYSLRTPGSTPQSQQVVVRYDSVDLAVLGIEVRLNDALATLPQAINTRTVESARTAGSAASAPPALVLETRSGERFEMPMSAVGTGSRQATREGFASLTPTSQRDLLKAYLDKQELRWGTSAPERLSHLNPLALEWYGPEALAHLAALLSDERPVLGAALLKYLCLEAPARSEPRLDFSLGSERLLEAMVTCIDRQRAEMPKSIAMMDRLLAQDLGNLVASDARALNAFIDFRRDVCYVIALGPDAREARVALEASVAGKQGLAPSLQSLIDAALAVRDTPALAVPGVAPR